MNCIMVRISLTNGLNCWYTGMAYQLGLPSTKRKNLQIALLRLRWNMEYKYQGGYYEEVQGNTRVYGRLGSVAQKVRQR